MFNFSLAANLCFKDIFLGPKSSVKIQKTFFYTLQALYFGRFSIFAEQWVIYNYASILEVFTIISIAVFCVFINPAKRNVMVVKNEMRLLKQKRNVLQI